MFYEVKRVNANLIHLLAVYKLGKQMYPFDPQSGAGRFSAGSGGTGAAADRLQQGRLSVDCTSQRAVAFRQRSGVRHHQSCAQQRRALHQQPGQADCPSARQAVEIRIEDDGRGYPPAMLLDGSELGPQGGGFRQWRSTGLGCILLLQVAQQRNRGQHGSIRLENGGEYGGGCFVLLLP